MRVEALYTLKTWGELKYGDVSGTRHVALTVDDRGKFRSGSVRIVRNTCVGLHKQQHIRQESWNMTEDEDSRRHIGPIATGARPIARSGRIFGGQLRGRPTLRHLCVV